MSKFFSLENKNIFLWGKTELTDRIYNSLAQNNYKVSGIIEKTGHTVSNLRLYNLEQIKDRCEKNDAVFVLCLRSALNHEALAKSIYNEGFSNIIFAPLTIGNKNVSYFMRDVYQDFLYGRNMMRFFPTMDYLLESKADFRILKVFNNHFELQVDIKYLRTFYRDSVDKRMLCYRDKHIGEFSFINELYDYLYNNGDFPKNYLEVYMEGTKEKEFLSDRKRLYDIFRKNVEIYGWRFFESIPISVEANENGLNIIDGMHRASFLYKEGAKYVPVIVSWDDFVRFEEMI